MKIFLFLLSLLPHILIANPSTPNDSFLKPTVVSDEKYQELFLPLERKYFFSPENNCPVKRLEANTWLLSSPEHLHLQKASIYLGQVKGNKGLALYRLKSSDYNYLWPLFFQKQADIPQSTLMVLWEESPSTYGAVLPVMGKQALVELRAEQGKLLADVDTGFVNSDEESIPLAIAGYDSNPYRLLQRLCKHAKNYSPFPPSTHYKTPPWTQYIGWSSEKVWPEKMTHQEILALIKEMENLSASFGFFLIDSPWQSLNEKHQLISHEFHSDLLVGLSPLVEEIKARLSVKHVGISHSIFGSSQGVAPHSPLGQAFQMLPKGLVHPKDFKSFIHLLHAPLQEADIDFIFLKDLSNTLNSIKGQLPIVEGSKALQESFYQSYHNTFQKGLIKDQAHNTLYLWSSRPDEIIKVASNKRFGMKNDSKTELYQSAYNSLLISQLAIPDWGSFSTSLKDSYAQAAARVISGGPLTVNDVPDDLDIQLLSLMSLPNGKCFEWDHFAYPTRSSLFYDPKQDQPLMLFNSQKEVKTLAIFNLKQHDTGYLMGPQDVDLALNEDKTLYALYSFKEGYLGKVSVKDWIQRKVKALDWDIVTFAPVKQGVAVLGNPRSLNPYGWIESYRWSEKDGVSQLNIYTKAKGPITLITYQHPYAIYHKGVKLPFNWDGKVLEIDTPVGEGKLELEIFFYKK